MADENADDLKKKFDEVAASRDAAKEKARQLEAELEKYKTTETTRAEKEAKEREAAEQAKLVEMGKYQEAIKGIEAKHSQYVNELVSEFESALVPAAIKSAAGRVKNIVPEAVEEVAKVLGNVVRWDRKAKTPVVYGSDGKPLLDEKLNPVPVDAFVTTYVSQRPYYLRDTMPMSTGLRPGQLSSNQSFTMEQALRDPAVMSAWAKADPQGLEKATQEYTSLDAIRERKKGK